ncbi:MAG TPA: hypothetical protein VGX68_18645 [Thermoanaerobaculia bacterium]|jgi:hypothetical protein|nr:hypothetical protein [Thermoanaerobaculia bacterium]
MRPIQVEVVAELAFLLHRTLGIHQGMLSYDVQRVVARYDLIGDTWVDLISGAEVGYPEHFADIEGRIVRIVGNE